MSRIRDLWLWILHFLAMNIPFGSVKRALYRIRGTKVHGNVDIAMGVFEESYPELVEIEENVDIGPNVIIVAHDSSYHCRFSQIYPLFARGLQSKGTHI